MKDRVRRLLFFPDEPLKAVISGLSLCNKSGYRILFPGGQSLPMARQKYKRANLILRSVLFKALIDPASRAARATI